MRVQHILQSKTRIQAPLLGTANNSAIVRHSQEAARLRTSVIIQTLANDLSLTAAPWSSTTVKRPKEVSVIEETLALEKKDGNNPSLGWVSQPHHLSKDLLWEKLRTEAKADADSEPSLASYLYSTILVHANLERSMAFLLANKLANATLLSTQLMRLIQEAYDDDPDIIEATCADMLAVYDRDPACEKYSQCVLFFKGYQAIQCYRIAHWLWKRGRRALALAIQSRVSEAFHVDIHPAARIGRGVLMDHATGVVIGETAIVGDNVSMLHHVTLGGSGTGTCVRHPHIGHGVLLGAGVSVLGPVKINAGSKVGAGSVVVTDIPPYCVAVGVPARVIKRNINMEPVKDMDQCTDFILDYVI